MSNVASRSKYYDDSTLVPTLGEESMTMGFTFPVSKKHRYNSNE